MLNYVGPISVVLAGALMWNISKKSVPWQSPRYKRREKISEFHTVSIENNVYDFVIPNESYLFNMFILTIIEFFLLIFFVAYLVYYYAQKEVPLYVKLLCFTSWIMSFGIVFILPHDIYYVTISWYICRPPCFTKMWQIEVGSTPSPHYGPWYIGQILC